MPGADADVVVGVVGKALGLRGEVYVRLDADLPGEILDPGRVLSARAPAGRDPAAPPVPATLEVAAMRIHGGRRVVRFVGVATREAAESLRDVELVLPRDQVPLDEESYWADQLIGREVVDDAGAVVGVLEAVADGTAHDYLVVARPDGGELLIPAVAELVTVEGEVVVVHAIPGLLDPEP